jgi:predicted nucleic acid-binding protein
MHSGSQLVDSNILIRWIKSDDRDYQLVKSVVDYLLRHEVMHCYTSQNLGEFWKTCTRPVDRNGLGLSPQETDRRAQVIERNLHLLPNSPAVHQEWRAIVVAHSVSGARVHDARLVAAMRVHGLTNILTFNGRDFSRYHDIKAHHPLTLLRENP